MSMYAPLSYKCNSSHNRVLSFTKRLGCHTMVVFEECRSSIESLTSDYREKVVKKKGKRNYYRLLINWYFGQTSMSIYTLLII